MPDVLTKEPDGFFTLVTNMTLEEHRMILFMSTGFHSFESTGLNDNGTSLLYVYNGDFCNFFGMDPDCANPVSSKICMALAQTHVAISVQAKDGTESVTRTHWVENYRDDNPKECFLYGMAAMDLHPEVHEFLMQMRDMLSLPQGTGGGLDGLKAAQSPYTFQFYRFFKSWLLLGRKVATLPLKVVRWMLGVGAGKWKYYAVFKKNAIAVAQAEMRQHCDVAFEYEEIAEGGDVQSLKFKFMWNPDMAGATAKLRRFYRSLNAGKLSPLKDVFQEAPAKKTPAPDGEAPAMEAPGPEAEAPAPEELAPEMEAPAPEAEAPAMEGPGPEAPAAEFAITARMASLLSGLAENGLTKRDVSFIFAMLGAAGEDNRIVFDTPQRMAWRLGWDLRSVDESLIALMRLGVIEDRGSGGSAYYFSRKYAWAWDAPPGP